MSDSPATTCPNCGAVLPEGLEKCSNCGTQLPPSEAATVVYPPVSSEPLQPVVLPSVEVPAGPNTTVHKTFSAKVDFQIPQSAVDKQGWLTAEQWQRLLDSYEAAIAAEMKRDMERGLPLRPSAQMGVGIPWEQVGDSLSFGQHAEIERALNELLGSVGVQDVQTIADLQQVLESNKLRQQTRRQSAGPKVTIGCSSLIFALGVLALIGAFIR